MCMCMYIQYTSQVGVAITTLLGRPVGCHVSTALGLCGFVALAFALGGPVNSLVHE